MPASIDMTRFDIDAIKNRINALSGVDTIEMTDESVAYVLELVIWKVLSYTNRETLNAALAKVCVELVALNWLKQYFLSDDMEGALTVGDVLSISEGDTRIAYQNRAQVEGSGAAYGSFAYSVEDIFTILKRYRRLHWGASEDEDYG